MRRGEASGADMEGSAEQVFCRYLASLQTVSAEGVRGVFAGSVTRGSREGPDRSEMIRFLAMAIDRRYDSGRFRRSRLTEKALECINLILRSTPRLGAVGVSVQALVDVSTKELPPPPIEGCEMVVDARGFPMEGDDTVASVIRRAHDVGWRRFTVIDAHGQRFFGCGLGPGSKGTKIEVYGTPGDYLASGLAGAEVVVHGNAQDQLGQILGSGKLVVHGDVGQTFMYGAKGGEVYVLGNAAGRPLINAVGKPRVVINGTCLDYLAESFMAGDPLNGGGFVVLNGVRFDTDGGLTELREPYPGGNLFSLASGGAIFIRDPRRKVGEDQLNGGRIVDLSEKDWQLILPYLNENERLFGITVRDLLTVDGTLRRPSEVYRKVEAMPLSTLSNSNGNNEH
jgi:glutamate synthase domain-containing protein 3